MFRFFPVSPVVFEHVVDAVHNFSRISGLGLFIFDDHVSGKTQDVSVNCFEKGHSHSTLEFYLIFDFRHIGILLLNLCADFYSSLCFCRTTASFAMCLRSLINAACVGKLHCFDLSDGADLNIQIAD